MRTARTPRIGLGLPVDDPAVLLDWARRADATPFSTLGLLDRLVYDNPEPLVTLAALAGATSRVRVQTEVLLAPHHGTALLAKQTATLDRMSGGRFTLGIGVGGREDDCRAAGIDIRRRGRRLDEQMETLRRIWAGHPYDDAEGVGPIGPAPLTPAAPRSCSGASHRRPSPAWPASATASSGPRCLRSGWTRCSATWSGSGTSTAAPAARAWSPRSMWRSARTT